MQGLRNFTSQALLRRKVLEDMLLLNKVVKEESSKCEIKKQTIEYKDEMKRGPIMSRELAKKTTAQIWAGR